MAEIPVQSSQEQDIYSFGFDLNLNKQVVLGADQSGYGQSTSNVEVGGVFIGSILQDCLIANSVLFDNKLNNVLIGRNVLNLKTTGNNNIAIGFEVLNNNTTGNNNIGIGYQALNANTIGYQNTGFGYRVLWRNTGGFSNIAIGNQAVVNQSTGSYNIGIGDSSLFTNTIGAYNIAIGVGANVGSNNLTDAIAIGSSAIVAASNTLVIGAISGQTHALSVAIGRTTASATLDVNGDILANNLSGWIAATETWTYASADSPTFTFTISGDKTTKYSAGMRIKLTQTTEKYFIITAVSYSNPNTTVTIYGGTDYTLANATITTPTFSSLKAPYGFPLDPTKWTVRSTNTTQRSQASPSDATWYNLGSEQVVAPIGLWTLRYWVLAGQQTATSTNTELYFSFKVTASTGNNTESNTDLTTTFSEERATTTSTNPTQFIRAHASKVISLSTKTTYFLNIKANGNSIAPSTLFYFNDLNIMIIEAVCAYL